jgi:predicted Fe-Mo cluster-binding NifX family protein
MKIALPTKENDVDDHFGHCAYYTVFTVDNDKKIISEERVDSPAGCGCKSNIVHTLADKGVTLMLAGNIGDGAIRVLGTKNIQVVRGCSGNVRDVADKWLSGVLVDSGDICHLHEHNCHK